MKVHFIAIGGSVMHQLALALHRKGYSITGSDDEIFEPARSNLAAEGLLPEAEGWFPETIKPDMDAVILGMHARQDNPELQRARELNLTIYSFPEYIYQESKQKTRIVVGGSHGKTTTTSMIMHVLKNTGRNFDYLVGARLEGFEQSVRITDAPLIVCEGDEYPASVIEKRPKFHFLFPHIAIITGIAWDHINVFPTFDLYLEQFAIFIRNIMPGGRLIYNASDPELERLVAGNRRSDIEYIPYHLPAYKIMQGKTMVDIDGYRTSLKVFGNHNLLNLQATWLACLETGTAPEQFVQAIGSFTGASKRLELMAESGNTAVYRDFAHAPSKVMATMEAVKQQYPQRRLVAVLELHTFSSLNEQFIGQYNGSMDNADAAAVFYSQHALELKRMPPLNAEKVRAAFGNNRLAVVNTKEQLMEWLREQSYNNANLVLMSSGNYDGADILTFAKEVAASS